jgi:CheY-specific phosphatase CheX
MNDALALGTLSKDSVSTKVQALSILSSQNTLAIYKEQCVVAVTQFASLMGMQYDGVDAIDTPPALAFTLSADGNTTAKLKKEAFAIAREDPAIKKGEATKSPRTWTALSATTGIDCSHLRLWPRGPKR